MLIKCTSLISQNLIPNPGFDILTDCPTANSQIYLAYPWISATNGSINIMNSCSDFLNLKVPHAGKSIDSYQLPRSGDGYTELTVYISSNNLIKYLEVPLKEQLRKGLSYYIEFYVSPDLEKNEKKVYTDAIQLAFSDTFVYKEIKPHEFIPLNPVAENRGVLITDTVAWTRISGCYTAQGNEKYAIIGNFRSEADISLYIEDKSYWPWLSVFYIEDVMVMPFDPLPDTITLCNGDSKTLNAGFLDGKYIWSTGSTDSTITVQKAGKYTVEVFMEKCVLRDTILVFMGDKTSDFVPDTSLCKGDTLKLIAPILGNYLWSDGSDKSEFQTTESGSIDLEVDNKCGNFLYNTKAIFEDCDCNIYVPNAFSPNGDGINDVFKVFAACDFEYQITQFSIYDRWGGLVFTESNQNNIVWNGTSTGKVLSEGTYVWFMEYNFKRKGVLKKVLISGDINILR